MELERVEFTLEEILAIHQDWIARLYIQDRKTEAEIVAVLSQQSLIVTVDQVRRFIREWSLEPLPRDLDQELHDPSNVNLHSSRAPSSQSQIPQDPLTTGATSRSAPLPPLAIPAPYGSRTPAAHVDGPADHERYSHRPLPPLPANVKSSSPAQEHSPESSYFRIERVCIHGNDVRYCTEVGNSLSALPVGGPSSLKRYTDTEEFHEKISIGIFGNCGWVGGMLDPAPTPTPNQVVSQPAAREQPQKQEPEADSNIEESSGEIIELKYARARDMVSNKNRMRNRPAIRLHVGKGKHRLKIPPGEQHDGKGKEPEQKEERKRKRKDSGSEESLRAAEEEQA